MKKEKQVRSYQRRTKSGKTVTVKAHTAKYDAAEMVKEALKKKKGAGTEFEKKAGLREMPDYNLPMDEYVKKLREGMKSDKEDKDDVKKPSKTVKTKTAKKDKYIKGSGPLSTGKVIRDKSEIPAKLAKSYSTSEGISLKQAYQELMVASKRDYKKIADFHSGKTITPKKVSKVSKETSADSGSKSLKASATTTKAATKTSAPAFTAAEFKEWYRGTGSAADKKVAKALRAQLGRSGYRKLEDEAIDNYSSRGHLSMFKRVSGGSSASTKSNGGTSKKPSETRSTTTKRATSKGDYTPAFRDYVKKSGYELNKYGVLLKGGKPVENGYNITQSFAKAYRSGSKPTLPKQSSGRLTAVEKAYADYHKEQGRKGKPDYSSEEFMDFASTYKKQGSPRASKKTTAPTTSKRKEKMPDKVREKKRKHEEYLRKVKESGMSIDEYNRLH